MNKNFIMETINNQGQVNQQKILLVLMLIKIRKESNSYIQE